MLLSLHNTFTYPQTIQQVRILNIRHIQTLAGELVRDIVDAFM